MTDDEVRRRYAAEFGVEPSQVIGEPVDVMRAVLADIDDQVETYAALGFGGDDTAVS
jgi:hypothetical protein